MSGKSPVRNLRGVPWLNIKDYLWFYKPHQYLKSGAVSLYRSLVTSLHVRVYVALPYLSHSLTLAHMFAAGFNFHCFLRSMSKHAQ